MRTVDQDRARIAAETQRFLDDGGVIEQVPYLATNDVKIQLKRDPKSKERAQYVRGEKVSWK